MSREEVVSVNTVLHSLNMSVWRNPGFLCLEKKRGIGHLWLGPSVSGLFWVFLAGPSHWERSGRVETKPSLAPRVLAAPGLASGHAPSTRALTSTPASVPFL